MIMIEYLPTILSSLCLISCLSGQTLDFDGFGVPQSSLVNSSCNLLNKPQQAAVINWEVPCQLPPITSSYPFRVRNIATNGAVVKVPNENWCVSRFFLQVESRHGDDATKFTC